MLPTRESSINKSRNTLQVPFLAPEPSSGPERHEGFTIPTHRHICDAQRPPPILGHTLPVQVGIPHPAPVSRLSLTLPGPWTSSTICSWNISPRIELERDQPGGGGGKGIWSPGLEMD